MPEVEIKTYKGEKAYKKDAKKMAERGWQVIATNNEKPSFSSKLWKGRWAKTKYVVTYQKP